MTDMADSSSTPPTPPLPTLPTLPTLPPPDPAVPTSVLIAVEESPKPKRGKWIALAAVVVLLVGGFVGYLLMSGDDEGERYALQPALQSSQEVDSVAMKMTMSLGFLGEISADVRIDNEAQLAAMVMSMEVEDGGTMEMIIDTANGKVYFDNESLGADGFDVPTRWIVTDADDALGLGGLGANSDPGELTAALEDATTREDLGIEQRDGEDVRHYRLTVSLETLAAVSSELEEQFSGLGEEVPDDVVFDVYVTADNLLRAITYEMDLMGQTMEIEMEFSDYNSIEPIVLPDPSDVTEQEMPEF